MLHSCEVNIWSIGCVMYTFVGKLHFETSLTETSIRIKNDDYMIPLHINAVTTTLMKMLQPNLPAHPTQELLDGLHPFSYKIMEKGAEGLLQEPAADLLQQQLI